MKAFYNTWRVHLLNCRNEWEEWIGVRWDYYVTLVTPSHNNTYWGGELQWHLEGKAWSARGPPKVAQTHAIYNKPRQCIKKQSHPFVDKGPSSQSYGFSSSQVWMWEVNYKEGWALKNWCFQIVVLKKTLKESLGQQGDQIVNPKGNKPWIFIGRMDAEAEAPILWPSDVKSWLNGKDPDAGKDWGQEEMGVTEDEMVR